jgi:hypothetical protein
MARETTSLIASDKVQGMAVRRSNGDKLGTIERVMIDKRSGKVAYAVMTFGSFLGIGDEYRALPWNLLRYNERHRQSAPQYSDAYRRVGERNQP